MYYNFLRPLTVAIHIRDLNLVFCIVIMDP